MATQVQPVIDPVMEEQRLTNLVSDIIDEARRQGATACEVGASADAGLSATVRMGEVDTVEFNKDQGFGITVYFGQRKGSASTSDATPEAIRDTVRAACDIARYTSEDPCAGLADADQMATEFPDLDLYHPWGISAEEAIERAKECEEAARSFSPLITNSDGATVNTHQGCRVYGNSHGFIGPHRSSRQSVSCVVIGQKGDEMQRDYWYTVARNANMLEAMADVGRKAADRTIKRLGSRKVSTATVPVIFSAELAGGFVGHLMGAISGGALYREATFLLDHKGQKIFPDWVNIYERPQLKGGMGSVAFDGDGLQTRDQSFIVDGVLESYLLSTYSARKLGMVSTANSGGAHNLFLDSNAGDLEELVKDMGTGLLVTSLIGQGINMVTGDYSRGAGGFWVENGEIQYPVSEITIAGNLKDMFMNLRAVGNDVDRRGNIQSGSLLIDGLMVAGE
ncbi:metalloprotease PmbA [Parendozoicomonas haliclonae]|uniref:Peptidase PmbA n=1 Tax=Parendozoicomonas haliclonae TaxID=1960125 RepID=A0A1X7AFX0_9GAMM|nr:metalloprotease PmbA [Parendozoicomonas haliclonae]SMA37325.1 peptidase PmbA [Parendozoicomonas haliclonae]